VLGPRLDLDEVHNEVAERLVAHARQSLGCDLHEAREGCETPDVNVGRSAASLGHVAVPAASVVGLSEEGHEAGGTVRSHEEGKGAWVLIDYSIRPRRARNHIALYYGGS